MKSAHLRHVDNETLRHLGEADFDEFGVLRDGGRFRVPMKMTDAKPMSDGLMPQAHRHGWRISGRDATKGRDMSIYDAYDETVSRSWQSDYPDARPGDLCTCRGPEFAADFGSPGHLEDWNGKLVCVPDHSRSATGDARSIRDAAYRAYDAAISQEWRGPINKQRGDDGYRGHYNKAGQLVADPPAGRRDTRSLADQMKQHEANMQRLYDQRDRELSEMWRRG